MELSRCSVFFPEKSTGREWLGTSCSLVHLLFGAHRYLAVRLPTALASAGTVFAVFWLGQIPSGGTRKAGGPPRGAVCWLAELGPVCWRFPSVLGRTAFRVQLLPLFLTLCLALLWWGWRQRSWWRVVLAGACAGLVRTPIHRRVSAFLFLSFGLSFVLPFGSFAREKVRAGMVKRNLPWAGLCGRGRAGGRAAFSLLCSASRTLFLA